MFDRYVAGTKPSWKRRAWMIASLVVHGLAGIGLIIYSIIHVEEIAPPALSLTFFSAPPPPPPPPPPAGKKTQTERKPKTQPVQPTTISKLVQPKQEEKPEEDDGEEGGQEGGVKGGVAGGVVGGVIGGVVGGTGTTLGAPLKPKNVAAHQLDNEAIYKPEPHLPDIVKIQRKGTADPRFTGKVCIDQGGKVFQVQVLQGIAGADEAILGTIRTWKYKPQPIPVCFVATWVFQIQ